MTMASMMMMMVVMMTHFIDDIFPVRFVNESCDDEL